MFKTTFTEEELIELTIMDVRTQMESYGYKMTGTGTKTALQCKNVDENYFDIISRITKDTVESY